MIDDLVVEMLGIRVVALTRSQLTSLIVREVAGAQRVVIAHHNLHSVALCRHDARLRWLYNRAEYVHVDGMSLIVVARLLGLPLTSSHRTTYVDWFPQLLAIGQRRQWRLFYLGSSRESLAIGLQRVRAAFPGLQIEGAHGYFNPHSAENEARIARINEFQPDILFVGMGMPRQEHWIAENAERVEAKVTLAVGGCLDYVAGLVPIPPRWSGQVGLEWLFRLRAQPRRLAYRYLVEPWVLAPRLACELFRFRWPMTGLRRAARERLVPSESRLLHLRISAVDLDRVHAVQPPSLPSTVVYRVPLTEG